MKHDGSERPTSLPFYSFTPPDCHLSSASLRGVLPLAFSCSESAAAAAAAAAEETLTAVAAAVVMVVEKAAAANTEGFYRRQDLYFASGK